ncbi:MAG: hypothetical protein ACM34M_10430 [Ignavibacteria bacterium]
MIEQIVRVLAEILFNVEMGNYRNGRGFG